jgi:7-cyano-7-deazaguanine synthase
MNDFVYPLKVEKDLIQPKFFPLLSGGIDLSIATCIAIEKGIGQVNPIFINRGNKIGIHQAYSKEIEAVEKLTKILNIEEPIKIELPFSWYAEYKKFNPDAFPYGRNLLLMAVAAARVVTFRRSSSNIIVVGYTKSDMGDTSLDLVDSFNNTLRFAFDENEDNGIVQVWAPLIELRKSEAIKLAYDMGKEEIIKNTWSCYKNRERHCGECSGCIERKEAFKKANIEDPTEYITAGDVFFC